MFFSGVIIQIRNVKLKVRVQFLDRLAFILTLTGYAGHWRDTTAPNETVICDLSYSTRRSLTTMCSFGYTVSNSETNTFWAADLLHRLFHMPPIGQNWVDHFADGYDEVIELAAGNKGVSTRDSETLQYFALEAYAFDIVVQGVGCTGEQHEHEHEDKAEGGDLPEVSIPLLEVVGAVG